MPNDIVFSVVVGKNVIIIHWVAGIPGELCLSTRTEKLKNRR
jgi:hypothetical protein